MNRPTTRILVSAVALLAAALPAHGAAVSLDEALRLAVRNNRSIEALRESRNQASLNAGKAWTTMGPTVNFQASLNWNNEVVAEFPYTDPRAPGLLLNTENGACPTRQDPTLFAQPVSTGPACFLTQPRFNETVVRPGQSRTFTLSGSQPIFIGPFIPSLQLASEQEEMARANLKNARDQVLYNVAQLYYNTAAAEKFVRLSHQSYLNLVDHLRSAEAKFQVGQIPRMGVLQAQIEVTRAQASYIRARNDYQNALAALGNLLAVEEIPQIQSAEELTGPTLAVLDFPADPTAQALEKRGDMQAAAAQVEMAESGRNLAWTGFAPSLLLNGNLQRTSDAGAFGDEDSWAVMLVLNVPILQGGKRYFDVRDSYSRVRQARIQRDAKREEVKLDVRTALSNLEVTRENLTVAERQLELARENYAITRISFENGLATSLDMIDANQALLGAEINALREQMNSQLQQLAVLRAMGGLQQALGLASEDE